MSFRLTRIFLSSNGFIPDGSNTVSSSSSPSSVTTNSFAIFSPFENFLTIKKACSRSRAGFRLTPFYRGGWLFSLGCVGSAIGIGRCCEHLSSCLSSLWNGNADNSILYGIFDSVGVEISVGKAVIVDDFFEAVTNNLVECEARYKFTGFAGRTTVLALDLDKDFLSAVSVGNLCCFYGNIVCTVSRCHDIRDHSLISYTCVNHNLNSFSPLGIYKNFYVCHVLLAKPTNLFTRLP